MFSNTASPVIVKFEGPVVDAHLVPPDEELHGGVHRDHRGGHLEIPGLLPGTILGKILVPSHSKVTNTVKVVFPFLRISICQALVYRSPNKRYSPGTRSKLRGIFY